MAAAIQQSPTQSPTQSLTQSLTQETQWHERVVKQQQQPVYADQRFDWMVQLREYCFGSQSELVTANDADDRVVLEAMLHLAERLCDWPMVVYLRELLDPFLAYTEDGLQNKAGLAEAYHQQGDLLAAADCIRCCLLTAHQQPQLAQYYWQLQQQLQAEHIPLAALEQGPLRLTPMTQYHLEPFRWAYADPKIGQLCNLPEFEEHQQWYQWLQENQNQERHLYAINHSDWGFIGTACLEVFDRIGYFYYWIGADFQGAGFGPAAVEILLAVGRQYRAMDCCYAKVYDHNLPSRKAMQKLGFSQLALTIENPHDPDNSMGIELPYYLGPDKPQQQQIKELEHLFACQSER